MESFITRWDVELHDLCYVPEKWSFVGNFIFHPLFIPSYTKEKSMLAMCQTVSFWESQARSRPTPDFPLRSLIAPINASQVFKSYLRLLSPAEPFCLLHANIVCNSLYSLNRSHTIYFQISLWKNPRCRQSNLVFLKMQKKEKNVIFFFPFFSISLRQFLISVPGKLHSLFFFSHHNEVCLLLQQ